MILFRSELMAGLGFLLLAALPARAEIAPLPAFTKDPDLPRWTVRNGLSVSLEPDTLNRGGAPRGLIRVGLPVRPGSREPLLLNFIAVEPVTMDGRRGLSELEKSRRDGKPGLHMWWDKIEETKDTLRLTMRMEKFDNGAHPYVIAELSPHHPNEVRFEVHAEPDSAPMKMCILTATMGNFQRLRVLRLKGRNVTTAEALPGDPGTGFTRHAFFPLSEMQRFRDGVIVEATGDEADARILSAALAKELPRWAYQGVNFVQYWRQPAPLDQDLRVAVNARKTYYRRETPIPGGNAFENFELNAGFHAGQVFIYGVGSPTPAR